MLTLTIVYACAGREEALQVANMLLKTRLFSPNNLDANSNTKGDNTFFVDSVQALYQLQVIIWVVRTRIVYACDFLHVIFWFV